MRPTRALLIRGDSTIPLELAPMLGDFDDSYEHWRAGIRLECHDRLQFHEVRAGLVIHFDNGYLVTAVEDVVVFRSEPA